MYSGAPIMNNGYYDIPINNQYSNQPMQRNTPVITDTYQINKELRNTVNNNQGNYVIYNKPNLPSSSLYIESDKPMSGYYQDPMKIPLMKKKEMNGQGYVEHYNNGNSELLGRGAGIGPGSGYTLGPGRNIQNPYIDMQYQNQWSYNDPGYTNYSFVPQLQQPKQIIYQKPVQYVNNEDIEIETVDEIPVYHKNKKNEKNVKNKKNMKKIKNQDISKKYKNHIDNRTLWNIIIAMSFIIFCFLLKTSYDYKLIKFK